MSWFNRKQDAPQDGEQGPQQEVLEYDPRYYEEIDVCADDTMRPREHRYLREKATQRIVGRVVYQKPTKRR